MFDGWECRARGPCCRLRIKSPRPHAAGAAQDPGLCSALLGRRALGTIGDPCCRSTGPSRRAQQSNPQSPQFVSIQSRLGLPGLPQVSGTLSMTDGPATPRRASIHDPTPTWHRLNQRPSRPGLYYLDYLYLDSSPQKFPSRSPQRWNLPPTTSQSETFIPSALSHLSTPSWFHCN